MVQTVPISYGSDPELFLMRNGRVIGSEKVIPVKGLFAGSYKPGVVRDGIQVEFNPSAGRPPELGTQITNCFGNLQQYLEKSHPDVVPCFAGVVEVDAEEIASLSPTSRVLGCQPSFNAYGIKPITVDAETYRKRSAGGHIHMGLNRVPIIMSHSNENRQRIVPHLDIFVGNTCVLLDRDPNAAERRENYGRAGEYRLQPHGLEYRTLSNFWLRHYSLLSLVCGLVNFAVSVIYTSLTSEDIEQELVDIVDIQKVIRAIDTNDFDLALENFKTIRPFFVKHVGLDETFGLVPAYLDKFVTFAHGVREKGLPTFFPLDPVKHWTTGTQVEFPAYLRSL